MKAYISILCLLFLASCQPKNQKIAEDKSFSSFFVGTYTGEKSEGIYKYLLKPNGKLELIGLAAKSDNPSFLTLSTDGKYLLAVNEINNDKGEGTVESFKVSDDSLTFLSRSSSGGAHPCFISMNKEGYVLAANYSGGNVGLLKLNEKGELSDLLDVQQHKGSGSTDRQAGPHAHSAYFEEEGNDIISVDLGTNEILFSILEKERNKLVPSYPHRLKMDPGAGPRHLAFHPTEKWIYLVNELNSTITLLAKDEKGDYQKKSSHSTLPSDYTEDNYCADIHISSDGRFLYASNRGHNSIAIFEVLRGSGKLKVLGHHSTHGEWPRNFSLSPDEEFLVVANQNSGNIVSLKRDKEKGLLEFVHEIEAPSPVCILFQK